MEDETNEEMPEKKIKPERVNKANFLDKLRDNPWMPAAFVLGIVLIAVLIFGSIGTTDYTVSEEDAADNLLKFINSQSQEVGEVEIVSVEQEGSLYNVVVNLNGQEIPVFVSLDGKYLIAEPIPLDFDFSEIDQGNVNTVPVKVEIGDSPINGKADAPVTIVEFSDYQCPFCKRFFEETLPLIEENYIKTGKVKLFYMDFPLSNIHPEAQKAAEAALCVRDQKKDEGYWKMHNLLFENQASLSKENYIKWAKSLGVNPKTFEECLNSGKFASAVNSDFSYGSSLGVSGTPAFFINGKLISGAQPYAAFEQIIEAELASASGAVQESGEFVELRNEEI